MSRVSSLGATLLLTLIVAACGDDGLSPTREYERAYARWTEQGLTHYTVEVRVSCFCPPTLHYWHRITVADDSVTAAVLVDSSATSAEVGPSHPEWYSTIDQMFTEIARVRGRRDGSRVDATYDVVTGIPTQISFRAPPGVADGDASYSYRALQPALIQ